MLTDEKVIKLKSGILSINNITHLIKHAGFTKIITIKGEVFSNEKLPIEYETQLNQFGFIKANNNTLVNIRMINNIYHKNRILVMENNYKIKVSRRLLHKFKSFVTSDQNETENLSDK